MEVKVSSLKKRLQLFMTLLLAVFFLVILMPFAYSQNRANIINLIDEVPVVIEGNTIFYIQTKAEELSLEQRKKTIAKRIENIARDKSITIDYLTIKEQDLSTKKFAKETLIITINNAEAKAASRERQGFAQVYLKIIQYSLVKYREERSSEKLKLKSIYAIVATFEFLFVGIIFNLIYRKSTNKLNNWYDNRRLNVTRQNLEIIPSYRSKNTLNFIFKTIAVVFIAWLLYF
ncbi:MAG: hypothetical protein F6K10_35460 [Moorea sp. SIO2B7]|nr:hypothetical protein [Moorena sp. SIO2B7]